MFLPCDASTELLSAKAETERETQIKRQMQTWEECGFYTPMVCKYSVCVLQKVVHSKTTHHLYISFIVDKNIYLARYI